MAGELEGTGEAIGQHLHAADSRGKRAGKEHDTHRHRIRAIDR
jgi:hypothetical protein